MQYLLISVILGIIAAAEARHRHFYVCNVGENDSDNDCLQYYMLGVLSIGVLRKMLVIGERRAMAVAYSW